MSDISETIDGESVETLAEWWSFLNREPGMCNLENYIEVMNYIQNKITHKECLRDWNKERMTNDEFEKWWDNKQS